jgi:uncharacterized membrane protein YfcA
LFNRLVPFLILFATLLFSVQAPVQAWLRRRGGTRTTPPSLWLPGAIILLFLVAIYGGYFGAGSSIMLLSALSIIGMSPASGAGAKTQGGLPDILQMTALTSFYSLCINGVAALIFISARMVSWQYVFPMAGAAMLGGYGAAGIARRIGRVAVRRFVMAVGFTISALMLARSF